MIPTLISWFTDPNMRWILMGSLLLGLGSGVIGSFTVLRKQSLLGDTLAHAALPGICIAFMLSGVKSMGLFMIGAIISGMIATLGIHIITSFSRIKQDAALGITLSVFFGVGVVLMTKIQHSGNGNQSGLDKYMFGQAASMMLSDVYLMGTVSLLLILICALLFKEFKLVSFDPGFARGMGLKVAVLEQLLLLMTVVAVVVGIQAVGVVLVAALLITPAVAARYWSDALGVMVILAGLFGALSGVIGTLISSTLSNLPTGPVTVLSATSIFFVSAVFAPGRGLIAKWIQRVRNRRVIQPNIESVGTHAVLQRTAAVERSTE
ncbi:manganese/zinc/iron transport system permease protein [Paenibacillus anaericanus]|uniref:metal ABC transporter permease n=1 Tax=Paenibacillus anaericanus TaxID=170367 RepID=UPI002785287D|nr:iron chelate uptake ABC transporter family permease subunit [Paenibacillus anaericanus]MDQ0090688.1 manganese/zinc/iron transport system permease protein [Paenibacillus anaericanus]